MNPLAVIQSNLIGAFWQPCDPSNSNSDDVVTLTYTDGCVTYRGDEARTIMTHLYKRLLCRQFALTVTPIIQGEVAA